MKFAGQTEIAAYLSEWPEQGDDVRAWLSEMKRRAWSSAADLVRDFQNVDASHSPLVIFYLVPVGPRIETLINFRLGVVLLTRIEPYTTTLGRTSQTWNAPRDH